MYGGRLKKKIKEYAKKKGKISIPEIQVEFKLDYKEASSIVHTLCDEEFMGLKCGIEYEVYDTSYTWKERQARFNTDNDVLKVYDNLFSPDRVVDSINDYDKSERFVLKALAVCITKKEISVADLKTALSCTYIKAYWAVDWMLYNGYVVSEEIDNRNYYKSKMTKQKYAKKFGIRVDDALRDNCQDS